MNQDPPIQGVPPLLSSYRDRSTGLILFGVLELLLGVLCLVLVGLMVFGQLMLARTSGAPVNAQMLIPGIAFYAGVAVAFAWLGIGSIQCRRWARALLLILAWVWLCTGILMVPMMAWIMPRVLASAPAGGQPLPHGALAVVLTIQLLFIGVFFILLPGALVLFYRSRHVKETCEARDPVRRWTDQCPLPVLAVACLMWCSTAMMLVLPLAKVAVLPFFGVLLSGLPGGALMIGMACVLFWIGRSWYRMKAAGWWVLMAVIVVAGLSGALTFARVSMAELYQKLGYPQAQIDLIQQQGWMTGSFMMWSSLIWLVPVLGYLVWVKRFFRPFDT